MSGVSSRTTQSEEMTHEVREVVREHVRHLGWKRGLHTAAARMGITERRAKALYTGEPLRLLADEWHAANDARLDLRRDRAARLRAELAELERKMNEAEVLARSGALVGRAGGSRA